VLHLELKPDASVETKSQHFQLQKNAILTMAKFGLGMFEHLRLYSKGFSLWCDLIL